MSCPKLQSMLAKVDKLIIGGGMVFTFLKARGLNVGSSLVEEDQLDLAKKVLCIEYIVRNCWIPDVREQPVDEISSRLDCLVPLVSMPSHTSCSLNLQTPFTQIYVIYVTNGLYICMLYDCS